MSPAVAAVAVLFAFAVAACGNDAGSAKRGVASKGSATPRTRDSAAGTIDFGAGTYRPGTLSAVGRVSGTITLDGSPPPDTTHITVDQKVCGVVPPAMVTTNPKGGLSNAVVWIADANTGKPLPIDKRLEVSSEKCDADPRVQATVVGATVNVYNDDKLLHKLVFTRAGAHDTLAVMPFFNAGQVVASERLTKMPGIVEMRCVQHPWTRGYIVVFDHPYFAVTQGDGSFSIDSLPPGRYRMMVWHEGAAKPVERQIDVAPGGAAKVDLAIRLSS